MNAPLSESAMAGDSFRLGYRPQRHWGAVMAGAFVCGELGAGLFVVSLLYGSLPGLFLGLAITAFGKSTLHLVHMGVPGKSWRAILRPDRSWTSRGLIAIVAFVGAGTLHAVDLVLGGILPSGAALPYIAGAAALVIMTYQGFAMSHSTAIALWNTAMMPIAGLLYGLTGGVLVALLLPAQGGLLAESHMTWMAAALLSADLVMVLSIVHVAHHGSPGARLSAGLLVRTRYAKWFHGGVLAAGILLPVAALGLGGGGPVARFTAAAAMLAGFFVFRLLIFRAGLYEPVMSFPLPTDRQKD